MTDRDLLETIEAVYELACWLADMGVVDFDGFAGLADVIRELRAREARNAA